MKKVYKKDGARHERDLLNLRVRSLHRWDRPFLAEGLWKHLCVCIRAFLRGGLDEAEVVLEGEGGNEDRGVAALVLLQTFTVGIFAS